MVLIGAEVQGSAEDKINEIIDEHKVQFTVTKGIIGPNLSNSIPHMAVFAANGDLVFNGHPNNAEKAIKTALKDVKEEPATTSPDKGVKLPRKKYPYIRRSNAVIPDVMYIKG